jgi:hypothetical protein
MSRFQNPDSFSIDSLTKTGQEMILKTKAAYLTPGTPEGEVDSQAGPCLTL